MRPIFILLFLTVSPLADAQLLTPTNVVDIPMRDGKTLKADVYVPSSCTSCPAILIQTPYSRLLFRAGLPLGFLQNIESSPYAWVIVDWRGFYGSAAASVASPNRGQDGYDVIQWITEQSWSNDKVGTWGPSALGVIQYQTARENHPAHRCAVPVVAHPQTAYDDYFYGGVLEKSRLEQLDGLGYGLSPMVLGNPYYNLLWQTAETSTWYPSSIKIPMLQIGGWYDHNIDKMMDWYAATVSSGDIAARDEQWLLVGPWVHGGTGTAKVGTPNQGELTYSNAAFENDTRALDFFSYYLLGAANNWNNTPKITYYELGKNTWNSTNSPGIESSSTSALFLKENNLLTANVSGTGYASFLSDPKNPSPTIGGPTLSDELEQGPYDQIALDGRSDVISFSTGDLVSDFTISGRVKATLYVECDQPDADIAIRMVDVYPDGKNMLINDGIRRMRFRNGYRKTDEAFMTSGQVYPVDIELPFVNYTWKSGHALKIFISGNSATRWDVNLQNGGTMYTQGDSNTAMIKIHHSVSYPSEILLPGASPVLSVFSKDLPESLIAVYPNPAKNKIRIQTGMQDTEFEYSIMNRLGIILKSGKTTSAREIDLSDMSQGVYVFQLKSGQTVQSEVLIKE